VSKPFESKSHAKPVEPPKPSPVVTAPVPEKKVAPPPAPVEVKPTQPQAPKPPVVQAVKPVVNGNGNGAKSPTNGNGNHAVPESSNAKYDPSTKNEQTAQRLARLLVSEIKLYYKSKTDGVELTENIYDLLKEPIDKSRKHYEQRMGKEAVKSMPDYFHGELVRSLCAGDESRLGPNYPA
jgi:hypothetical protein